MKDNAAAVLVYVVCAAMAVAFGVYSCALSDDFTAPLRAVESSGYTNVKVLSGSSFAPFSGCSDSDGLTYKAEATNAQGARVKLLVCCGAVVKACTVRVP